MKTSCDTFDTKCFQAVEGVLVSPKNTLESRQLGVIAFLAVAIAVLIPWWYGSTGEERLPIPLEFSPSQVSQASSLATATAIVVATGPASTPVATITPGPEPTVVPGYVVPLSVDRRGHDGGLQPAACLERQLG